MILLEIFDIDDIMMEMRKSILSTKLHVFTNRSNIPMCNYTNLISVVAKPIISF